jgi:hypothetical protein
MYWDKPIFHNIEPRTVKKWLARPGNVRISTQNPWYFAKEMNSAKVTVYEIEDVPVIQVTQYRGETRNFIVRPDLVGSLNLFMKESGLDQEQFGYLFCPKNIGLPLHTGKTQEFVQAVQYTRHFDPTLSGHKNSHLRQNLRRSERMGLTFEDSLTYRTADIEQLVAKWAMNKQLGRSSEEKPNPRKFNIEKAIDVNSHRFRSVAENPFGRIYGARSQDGILRAAAAVLHMGDYLSMECIASFRDEYRAMEFLETNMWRDFKKKEVYIIDRGPWSTQNPALRDHKEKYAPLLQITWKNAQPYRPG